MNIKINNREYPISYEFLSVLLKESYDIPLEFSSQYCIENFTPYDIFAHMLYKSVKHDITLGLYSKFIVKPDNSKELHGNIDIDKTIKNNGIIDCSTVIGNLHYNKVTMHNKQDVINCIYSALNILKGVDKENYFDYSIIKDLSNIVRINLHQSNDKFNLDMLYENSKTEPYILTIKICRLIISCKLSLESKDNGNVDDLLDMIMTSIVENFFRKTIDNRLHGNNRYKLKVKRQTFAGTIGIHGGETDISILISDRTTKKLASLCIVEVKTGKLKDKNDRKIAIWAGQVSNYLLGVESKEENKGNRSYSKLGIILSMKYNNIGIREVNDISTYNDLREANYLTHLQFNFNLDNKDDIDNEINHLIETINIIINELISKYEKNI